MMAKTLGVICARGGSKGLPDKNLAKVDNRELICLSMDQAVHSRLLTRWVVSTDSEEISDTVCENGRGDNVPFLRPAELAQDDSHIEGALKHALKFCEDEEDSQYDHICMLLNTHPLRIPDDIDACIELAEQHPVDSVISGYWIEHPYELRTVGMKKMFDGYRRQDVDSLFLGNGAVVVTTRQCLLEKDSIWGDTSVPYIMHRWRSIDIDGKEDLWYVRRLLWGMRKWGALSAETAVALARALP